MLFKAAILEKIVSGTVTVAFRRWTSARVEPGQRITTAKGLIAIESIEPVSRAVTLREARAAGYESTATLLAGLRSEGQLFRIALRFAGEDPRTALREQADMSPTDFDDLQARLQRLDKCSRQGPWTREMLDVIASHPGVRAAELAEAAGRETPAFKTDVRKLKALGLTESLAIGYRLAPRGRAYLTALTRQKNRRLP